MTLDAHQQFVDDLKSRGVFSSHDMEAAFCAVPRHCFLPQVSLKDVYTDRYVVVAQVKNGRASSSSTQPSFMAKMLQQLGVEKGQRVLEIGTATGFNAALLSHLLGSQGVVVSIEFDPQLVTFATENLTRLGYTHLSSPPAESDVPLCWLAKSGVAPIGLACGDAWNGVRLSVPFQRLMATIGSSDISPAWLRQTTPDCRLVVPLTLFPQLTLSIAFDRRGNELISRSIVPCSFVPARGRMATRANDWSRLQIVASPVSGELGTSPPYCVIQTPEMNLRVLLSDDSVPVP